MANTNTKKTEDELVAPTLPDIGNINKNALNAASANLSAARGALNNMSYDTFKQGTAYAGLKKSYEQQGRTAMQDTLGQVAARTGGMASSYATSAANQSYNNYMQTLEDAARAMYNDEYSKARDKVDLAQQGYNNAYGEYRDNVGDAWTRYNAERGVYESDRNYNYRVDRDNEADNDAAKEDEIDMLSTDAYYGKAVSWEEYSSAHPNTQLDPSEYESIVNAATGRRTDDNRTNVDKEFESIFGAEGFVWGDWNKDGNVDQKDSGFAPDFSTSSYGEDYWKQFHSDKQQGYADADTKEAQEEVMAILEAGGTPDTALLERAGWVTGEVKDDNKDGIPDGLTGLARTMWENNIKSQTEADTKEAQDSAVADINARIANGESLEKIAEAYGIDGTTNTWESVTGMSKAEIEQKIVEKMTPNSLWALLGSGDALESIFEDKKYDNTPYSNYFNKEYGPTAYEDFKSALYDLAHWCDYEAVVEFLEKYPDMADDALRFFDTVAPTVFKGNGANVTGLINSDAYKEWTQSLNNQEAQDSAVDDINARIANGESLEKIAKAYGIDEKTNTWESVTGMSQAEWQQIYNDNEAKNYTYQNTSTGRNDIVSTLTNSASFSLSDKDQKNFDHIFGKGAYKTLTEDVATLAGGLSDKLLKWSRSADRYDSLDTEFFNNILTDWINTTAEKIPGITRDQLVDVIEAQVPELCDWAENPDKAIPYIGKAYYNGKWITPKG